jgi:hypothetical protein
MWCGSEQLDEVTWVIGGVCKVQIVLQPMAV